MSVKINFEVGHEASLKTKPTPEGYTHDWELFVRGIDGHDISHYVDKVVFTLHESFPKPKRVFKEPPYIVKEAGYAAFMLPIEVYFKNRDDTKKLTISYDLDLQKYKIQKEEYVFNNPSDDFRRKLIKGGGVPVTTGQSTGAVSSGGGDYGKGSSSGSRDTKNAASNNNSATTTNKQNKYGKTDEPKMLNSFKELFGPSISKTTKISPEPKSSSSQQKQAANTSTSASSSKSQKSSSDNKSQSSSSKSESKESKSSSKHNKHNSSSSVPSPAKDAFSKKDDKYEKSSRISGVDEKQRNKEKVSKEQQIKEQQQQREASSKSGASSKDKVSKRPSSPKPRISSPKRSGSPAVKSTNTASTKAEESAKLALAKEADKSSSSKKSSKKEKKSDKGEKNKEREKQRTDKEQASNKREKEHITPTPPAVSSDDKKTKDLKSKGQIDAKEKFLKQQQSTNNENLKQTQHDTNVSEMSKKSEKHDKGNDRKHKHKKKEKNKDKDQSLPSSAPVLPTIPISTTPSTKDSKREKKEKTSIKSKGEPAPPVPPSPAKSTKDSIKQQQLNENQNSAPVPAKSGTKPSKSTLEDISDQDSSADSDSDSPPSVSGDKSDDSTDASGSRPHSRPTLAVAEQTKTVAKQEKHKKAKDKQIPVQATPPSKLEKEDRKRKRRSKEEMAAAAAAAEKMEPPPSKLAKKEKPVEQNYFKNGESTSTLSEETVNIFHDASNRQTNIVAPPTGIIPLPADKHLAADYLTELKTLQQKIMTLQDNNELQQVVEMIAATGQYEITQKTFDFDLCTLDRHTVQRLQDFFAGGNSKGDGLTVAS